ncbi:hypothetical protein DRN58_03425 [Thermococci archaeon]|nr:MAG: hypothetical protein DRN58_03425 [Thermococci archaeon]
MTKKGLIFRITTEISTVQKFVILLLFLFIQLIILNALYDTKKELIEKLFPSIYGSVSNILYLNSLFLTLAIFINYYVIRKKEYPFNTIIYFERLLYQLSIFIAIQNGLILSFYTLAYSLAWIVIVLPFVFIFYKMTLFELEGFEKFGHNRYKKLAKVEKNEIYRDSDIELRLKGIPYKRISIPHWQIKNIQQKEGYIAVLLNSNPQNKEINVYKNNIIGKVGKNKIRCSHCGSDILKDSKYCRFCGKKVDSKTKEFILRKELISSFELEYGELSYVYYNIESPLFEGVKKIRIDKEDINFGYDLSFLIKKILEKIDVSDSIDEYNLYLYDSEFPLPIKTKLKDVEGETLILKKENPSKSI